MCQFFKSGVGNPRPASRVWLSQIYYAARHLIWELANARREKYFQLRRRFLNIFTKFKRMGEQL
jgi:hypothetical protein